MAPCYWRDHYYDKSGVMLILLCLWETVSVGVLVPWMFLSMGIILFLQWNLQCLKPPVCYMSPQLIVPPCRSYWCRSTNKNCYKTCSFCGRDIWHIESKQILQPPKYLIIIVNRITFSNNRITKNKSRMPLDLYIKLGPIIHLLPKYFCTNSSWNVRAALCPEGRLSSLALSNVYSPTVCPFTTGRGVGTETRGMDNVFPSDDL